MIYFRTTFLSFLSLLSLLFIVQVIGLPLSMAEELPQPASENLPIEDQPSEGLVIALDAAPDSNDFSSLIGILPSKNFLGILPALPQSQFLRSNSFVPTGGTLSDHLFTWGELNDLLNWVGQLSFYSDEMKPYIQAHQEKTGGWFSSSFYTFELINPETDANQPALLSLKTAQRCCNVKSIHYWLYQKLQEINNGLTLNQEYQEERHDLIAQELRKENAWPLITDTKYGSQYIEQNLNLLNKIINKSSEVGTYMPQQRKLNDQALYRLPTEEELQGWNQTYLQEEQTEEPSLPVWSSDQAATPGAPQLAALRLALNESVMETAPQYKAVEKALQEDGITNTQEALHNQIAMLQATSFNEETQKDQAAIMLSRVIDIATICTTVYSVVELYRLCRGIYETTCFIGGNCLGKIPDSVINKVEKGFFTQEDMESIGMERDTAIRLTNLNDLRAIEEFNATEEMNDGNTYYRRLTAQQKKDYIKYKLESERVSLDEHSEGIISPYVYGDRLATKGQSKLYNTGLRAGISSIISGLLFYCGGIGNFTGNEY